MDWLNILKHLLPNARAWSLTTEKQLRKFFLGISGAAKNSQDFLDGVYSDLNPETTREVDQWEKQFGILNIGAGDSQRRDRISAAWKDRGGQSPRYLQDILQSAGFDVYIHEWWVPSTEHPSGGSVGGDVVPVVRSPFDYLDDGSDASKSFLMVDGAAGAQDGNQVAMDGSTDTPPGYPLVNKITTAANSVIGDGQIKMQDGGLFAQDGSSIVTYSLKRNTIPNDSDKFPFFLYVGAEVFPGQANVPENRRDEFEDLCLKICPSEQWIGVLVDYG
jgi:hypothetical protein